MSFVERLCKTTKKNILKGGFAKQKTETKEIDVNINRKQYKKYDQFHQNHSDLKDMLKLLQGGKNQNQCTRSVQLKSDSCQKKQERDSKSIRQCRKQNIRNKVQFLNVKGTSNDQRTYFQFRKKSEQLDSNQFDRFSLLRSNLKHTKNPKKTDKLKIIRPNPQTYQQKQTDKTHLFTSPQQTEKRGLQNIGNTCYMNAVLQCLFHLGNFSEGLKQDLDSHHREYINKTVIKKYIELYEGVYKNNNKFKDLSTLPLKKSVSKMCSMFIDFQQEDAHQFLRQLLDTMHTEINLVDDAPKYKSIMISPNSNLATIAQEYRRFYKRYDDSYIYKAFCSEFFSFVTCSNCKYESVTLQNYLDISLPLVKGLDSLQDLIQDYFEEQALGDYYSCQSCLKSSKNSLKKLDLWNPPNYFIINLKRSQFGKKNVDPIKIPTKTLNMKKFMKFRNDKIQKSAIYRLQGIVQHRGAIDGGHYWALVRDSNFWYNIDDNIVTKKSKQQVEEDLQKRGSDTAYLLFYELI